MHSYLLRTYNKLLGFDISLSSFQNSSGKFKTPNGFIGLPYHVSQDAGCQMRGQNCYVEVTLGCPKSVSDNPLQSNSDAMRNFPTNNVPESADVGRGDKKGSPDQLPVHEKTFIYPAEAVLVPVLHTSFARSSLKRYILQRVMQFFVVV